jgi:hypothetical protein
MDLLDLLQGGEAVGSRHEHIEQDDTWAGLLDFRKRCRERVTVENALLFVKYHFKRLADAELVVDEHQEW